MEGRPRSRQSSGSQTVRAVARRTDGGHSANIAEEIQNIIIRINQEVGLTIIRGEQNVAFASRAASKFLLMEKDRFVASGEIGKLTQDVIQRHLSV
jgi:urea transport system ATP-binding protein